MSVKVDIHTEVAEHCGQDYSEFETRIIEHCGQDKWDKWNTIKKDF